MSSRFTVGDDDFLLDGAPHRILSGALHYFRIHPDQWADRIHKARMLGLNTIETYVPWNDHQPTPDVWTADGPLDLGRFLDLVHAEGMHAIVRPGPYICAEYDNGGLPAWLFTDPVTGIRRFEPTFMAAVTRYLRHVYEIVVPRQIDHGGPVVLVQIENEYGAYGEDRQYLEALVDLTVASGVVVPLTTVDQPEPHMLENGSLPGLLKTGSFGSRSRERLATLREHQPTGPLMCSEFWNGWFDHWGDSHHVTPAADQARDLDDLLAAGASVNLYMLHGGTNFGFTNGANDKGVYEPIVTSYDYDAPLDEAGRPTEKYFAFREVFAKYTELPPFDLDVPAEEAPTPTVEPQGSAPLLETLPLLGDWAAADGDQPPTFDELGHYRGYLGLRADLPAATGPVEFAVGEVRDRVVVFVDGVRVGVLERAEGGRSLSLPAGRRLLLLVEDQGRVNYDRRIGEPKGLLGGVTVAGETLAWESLVPDVTKLTEVARGFAGRPIGTEADAACAAVAQFDFDLEAPSDLYLETSAAGKGVAFVNGFALGRYWRRGPQHTLFVPGPVTAAGRNVLVVFDTDDANPAFSFSPVPSLGQTVVDGMAVQGV